MMDKNQLKEKHEELFCAIQDNDTENTLRLLSGDLFNDYTVNDLGDDRGNTMLHWAIYNNNLEIAKALLKAGMDINAQNVYGETAHHISVRFRRKKATKFLIKNGADTTIRDVDGNNY